MEALARLPFLLLPISPSCHSTRKFLPSLPLFLLMVVCRSEAQARELEEKARRAEREAHSRELLRIEAEEQRMAAEEAMRRLREEKVRKKIKKNKKRKKEMKKKRSGQTRSNKVDDLIFHLVGDVASFPFASFLLSFCFVAARS
jgi:hypothetical protein